LQKPGRIPTTGPRRYCMASKGILCFLLFFSIARAQNLPAVMLRDLAGHQRSFASWVASGPIIVNFWATYCDPCRKEIPELKDVSRQTGLPLRLISVDPAGRENLVRRQAKEQQMESLILLDRYNNVLKLLKMDDGLPVTLLIHKGKILFSARGYDAGSTARLKKTICQRLNAC